MNIAGYDATVTTPAGTKRIGFVVDDDEQLFEQAAARRIAECAAMFGEPVEVLGVWERTPYEVHHLRYAFPADMPAELLEQVNKELAAVLRAMGERLSCADAAL